MPKTLLLTSFTTWMPHHISNASDDLVAELMRQQPNRPLYTLRQLPVDFTLAPQKAIAHLHQVRPDGVICCGMAEERTRLSVESRAVGDADVLYTGLDLEPLIAGLTVTEISHDAGRFVCNALYYALLQEGRSHFPQMPCLFIHVPPLTAANIQPILTDFQTILDRITSC